MARYYKRRRFYRKRKYNIENRVIRFLTPSLLENGFRQNFTEVVPATLTEGVRKVTKFTISLTAGVQDAVVYWALVYIPEGATTSALFPTSSDLFVPSNYVLGSGVNDSNAGPIRIRVPLSKNLNSNDRIFLITATTTQADVRFEGLARYAICYN